MPVLIGVQVLAVHQPLPQPREHHRHACSQSDASVSYLRTALALGTTCERAARQAGHARFRRVLRKRSVVAPDRAARGASTPSPSCLNKRATSSARPIPLDIWPTGECRPASTWIQADRLHPLIPRETLRFKSLYRNRGAVEREFGRLKNEWGLTPLRVRRIERVRLHADLTILAKLSCRSRERERCPARCPLERQRVIDPAGTAITLSHAGQLLVVVEVFGPP